MMKRLSIILLAVFLFNIGVSHAGSPKKAAIAPPINDVYVLLFILDGTPRDLLYGLLDEGKLPTLKEYFNDNGARVETAVTTFPSASAPAYQGFITGLFAGHSGIPYLQWYDRINQKGVDYLGKDYVRVNGDMRNLRAIQNPQVAGLDYPVTIFEKLHGLPTASVYSEVSRGALEKYPNLPIGAMSDVFLTQREERLDVRALGRVKKLFDKPISRVPRFMLVGLYSADVIQHKEGEGSSSARQALVQFDVFLKEFTEQLKGRGLFEKTYIVVTADHGMHNIKKEVDLETPLKNAGLKIRTNNPRQKKADVFISERGVASAHLYFRGKQFKSGRLVNGDAALRKGLDGRPDFERLKKYSIGRSKHIDVIELLRKIDDLGLTVVRHGYDRVEVYSKECHGTIAKIDFGGKTYYGYKPNGCDPLGYAETDSVKKMVDGTLYDDRTWLNATANLHYPDGVVQLGQIFDDGRAGDIFVVAADDKGFFKSKAATHGALVGDDMRVPLLIHGPAISRAKLGPLRTVDLYSTMLSWFGLPPEENQDGAPIDFNERPAVKNSSGPLQMARLESFMIGRPELIKTASLDSLEDEFLSFVGRTASVKRSKFFPVMEDELKRRSAYLAKITGYFSKMDKKDIFYPLMGEQIEKVRKDITRLQDIKKLLSDISVNSEASFTHSEPVEE